MSVPTAALSLARGRKCLEIAMVSTISSWSRKLHKWVGILIVVPLLIIGTSGILLMLKKHCAWIQPPTQRGSGQAPSISFAEILQAARKAPEANISGWDDVARLDVRPDKGIVKVRARNQWEVQIDTNTAAVLQVSRRRSDLIEDIHTGLWFHEYVNLFLSLPTGVLLLVVAVTGAHLFLVPIVRRRRKDSRRNE